MRSLNEVQSEISEICWSRLLSAVFIEKLSRVESVRVIVILEVFVVYFLSPMCWEEWIDGVLGEMAISSRMFS